MTKSKMKYKLRKKATHSYNRGNRAVQSAAYRKKHPQKVSAHSAVNRACKAGILKRPTKCPKCGNSGSIQAHHKDYGKWLEVIWLCWKCHNLIDNKKLGGEKWK